MELVGRDDQLDLLRRLLAEPRGRGTAVLVRGAPGIGKTALLAETAALAEGFGHQVLRTSGAEAESDIPYAGLQLVLRPLAAGAAQLAAPHRQALDTALGHAEAGVPDVFLVGLAVLNLLADAAAAAPVVVLVDDVQWLDDATACVLAFVARRIAGEPVLIVGAARDGYRSRLHSDEVTSVPLGPLTDGQAAQLLADHAPHLRPTAHRRLLAEAAGNPLALTELPRALDASADPHVSRLPLTERLERAFTDRLETLPDITRGLLRIAVLDDSPSLAEICRATRLLTGLPAGTADLEPAVPARLVQVVGNEVRFEHPLIRSAIHQTMPTGVRHAAHAALAAVLDDQPDRQLRHRAAAADDPREPVAAALEDAAHRAARRGGIAAAVTALEQAAALSEIADRRAERLLRAADFAVELGRPETVTRLLDQALTGPLSRRQHATVVWLRGSFDEGLHSHASGANSLTALAEEMAAQDRALALRILWSAAQLCFWSDPGPEGRRRVLRAVERMELDELDPWRLAICAYAAPVERGGYVLARARQVALKEGDDGRAYRMLSTASLLVGGFDLAREFSAAGGVPLRAQGRLGLLARTVGADAWSALVVGDLGAAIAATEESRRLARETSQTMMYALMTATAAKLAALRGEEESARELAEEAEGIGLPAGARPVLATASMARGLAALGAGRFEEAFGHLRRLHDPADPAFQVALRLTALGDLVDAATHCGRLDAVRPVVAELEQVATVTSAPVLHAELRLVRALSAADEDADPLFAAALRADLGAWPLIRARTRLAYGEWLRRRRRSVESRDHLRAARDMFDALGAIPWGERARRELRAAGETSRRRTPDARDRLTAHELQIVQLAADGLTNREIGQRLYLSHRTVSSHLHRIFPKLGVVSRAELRAVVHALR
ncbi:AAA family ATPase [Streptomyces mangrovisoli]|uniref:LuxR family transcriptional regulator n=1 Tax=Streptomyces mangrovisoli TaxID=1428628 RepID=A0A1J4NTH1_9ACTN|nr:helix-turn-helix transcriptional regulator [Streptomyces mangrovisoli]OIJ65410.1 LuxR family transcriptional regulator [Streptomyces mangrovisoli]